ncbi:hypothetical protein BGZ60DRAFT_530488 [Tricladium varicosporioides]|nr:hypothetical protein BGZ60DRAFT_530488 [Hymenoscyphus varicosporioides]
MRTFDNSSNPSPQASGNDHSSEMNNAVKTDSPNVACALIEMVVPKTTVKDITRVTEKQATEAEVLHFYQPAEVSITVSSLDSPGVGGSTLSTNISNVTNVVGVAGSQVPSNTTSFNPINQPSSNHMSGTSNQEVADTHMIEQQRVIAEQIVSSTTALASALVSQSTQSQPGQDSSKHAPVCGRNVHFKWEDNRHIDESPFKVGQLEYKKVSFKLIDTNGKKHKFAYVRRQTMDWNKKEDIARADKWRKQIFNRRLNKGDGEKHLRDRRPHWSEREKDSIATLVKERISTTGRRLNTHDWTIIASEHNKKFAGTQVRIGEKLPISTTPKGGLTKGGVVKVPHTITTRTAGAIYSQAQRWPDVKEMMENVLDEAEAGDKTDEDTEDTMDIDDDNNAKTAGTMANSDAGYDSYGDEIEDEETNPHNSQPSMNIHWPIRFDQPTKVHHDMSFQPFAPRQQKSPYGQHVGGVDDVERYQPFNTFSVAKSIPFVRKSSSPSTSSRVASPKTPVPLPNDNSANVKIVGDKQAITNGRKTDEAFIWGC